MEILETAVSFGDLLNQDLPWMIWLCELGDELQVELSLVAPHSYRLGEGRWFRGAIC